MIFNYYKVAIRNLLKNKGHSLINILGLAVGLATCILIILYVSNEWNFDRNFENSERTYRIVQTTSSDVKTEEQASTPFPLAPVVSEEFPHLIEKSVRFFDREETAHTFLNKETKASFRESNFYFVDSTFLDVFNVPLVQGNPDNALNNELSLVISEEVAQRFFGGENPIGQTLNYAGLKDMTVTGVMRSWPEQSHIKVDLVASFSSLNQIYRRSPGYDKSWLWNPVWTYVLLKDPDAATTLEDQLSTLKEKYYYAYSGWPLDEKIDLELQPITDIYLYSNRDNEMRANSSVFYLYLFSVIAAFILIIACINFTNLSTARSFERSREVGLRKAMGGDRSQLFAQFIGESFIISFIAIIIGVAIALLMLPFFNEITSSDISLSLFSSGYVIPGLLLLTVVVALLSGSYPAIFLSSFEPVQVLKGTNTKNANGSFFRKTLVTFQFTLSIFLLIGTAVTFLQLKHMQNKDLGFDKNHVLILPTKQNSISWEFDTFIEKAMQHAYVESVTGIDKIPGSKAQEYYRYVPDQGQNGKDGTNLVLHVTHNFLETFDVKLLAGRTFSREYSTDPENALLINKRMLPVLGVEDPEDAIGAIFHYYPTGEERQTFTVIGVLDDFNYSSVKKEIEPLAIRLIEGLYPVLQYVEHTAVEINPGNTASVLSHLESIWKELNPIDPFEYSFLDEELDKIYEAEATMSTLSSTFSILSVALACMGLLGLASYSAHQKRQEIGIRKSLGASVSNIVTLLSKEFMLLIIIANFIAWPVTYYLANMWLENFPYRIDLVSALPFIFGGAGFTVLLIALVTISYHSLKAGLMDPVEAIRRE